MTCNRSCANCLFPVPQKQHTQLCTLLVCTLLWVQKSGNEDCTVKKLRYGYHWHGKAASNSYTQFTHMTDFRDSSSLDTRSNPTKNPTHLDRYQRRNKAWWSLAQAHVLQKSSLSVLFYGFSLIFIPSGHEATNRNHIIDCSWNNWLER